MAVSSALFKKENLSPFESYWIHPFTDLQYQLSNKIISSVK